MKIPYTVLHAWTLTALSLQEAYYRLRKTYFFICEENNKLYIHSDINKYV